MTLARPPRRRPLVLVGLLAALGAACGDAMVDGAYRGDELFVVQGWVRLDLTDAPPPPPGSAEGDEAQSDSGPLRVAVFWAPAKGSTFHLDGAVEQDVATDGLFPARFRLALFAPPEDDLVKPVGDGFGALAVAVVLAYLDADRDARWDRASERVVGGAPDHLLVFTPDGVQSRLYGALAPGFHRLVALNECVARPDGSGFETRYGIGSGDLDLIVSMRFPIELFFDADCDGNPGEWLGVCPPLEQVRMVCREDVAPRPEDPMCGACEPLLPPLGALPDKCDAWFDSCLYSAPPHECETERAVCRGEVPVPVDPNCVDLRCVCQRVYDECLAVNGDELGCKGRYNDCLAR